MPGSNTSRSKSLENRPSERKSLSSSPNGSGSRDLFSWFSSGSSDKQGNGDFRGDSSPEKSKKNLFERYLPGLFGNQSQADSSLKGSELIVDAYGKAIIFGPVRATLEQFDQKVNDLIKQGEEVLTKANSTGGDRMGEGETLENRIESAKTLKTECDAHKQKLLDMDNCIYDLSEELFYTSSEMDIYNEFQSIINKTDDHILKQRVIRNGEDNVWQHIRQSKIKLIEKVQSQIEKIDASITEMDKALQKVTNHHRQLERQLAESQASYDILQQRLTGANTKLRTNQAIFNAARARLAASAHKVNKLVDRGTELHCVAQWFGSDLVQGDEGPIDQQIKSTATLISDLGYYQKKLYEMRITITEEKDQLSFTNSPVEEFARLRPIIKRIDDTTLKQQNVQDIVKDVQRQDRIWQQSDQSKIALIETAELQIKTLNASLKKTKEALQEAMNHQHRLAEGREPYNARQQAAAEETS